MLLLRLSLSLLLLAAAPAAHALVFVVDTTTDLSDALLTDDLCDVGTGRCSLRAAVEQANSTAGTDRIEFAIPGSVPQTIALGSPLAILETVAIDAATQPGSSVNTATTGTNVVLGVTLIGISSTEIQVAAPGVELRGFSIRGASGTLPCVLFGPTSSGSRFNGNSVSGCGGVGVQVEGDRIRIGGPALDARNLISNNDSGIRVTGNDNFILNNLIGTNPAGNGLFGNGAVGVDLDGDGNRVTDNTVVASQWGLTIDGDRNTLLRNRIGIPTLVGLGGGVLITGSANQIGLPSTTFAHANVIVRNATGVRITAPGGGNLIQGNYIGRLGTPNQGPAVDIQASSDNTVSNNEIDHNVAGVSVVESPTTPAIDNEIVENRIWANTAYSIRLGTSGSPHDDAVFGLPPDYDEGPNHLQNPPHINYAGVDPSQTTVAGYIDAQAGPYTLDFFSNPLCSGARRDGEFYLGAAHLDATGTATNPRTEFSFNLPVTASGRGFTATATDADDNTSEFSTCFTSLVTGGSDLVLTGTLSASTLNPGDTLRLSLRLENRGPFVATNVPVVVSLPPGFLSAWAPAPNFSPATGTWTVSSLAVNGVAMQILEATVVPAAGGQFAVNASAVFPFGQYDPNTVNNAASLGAFVRSGADLVVSQAAPPSAQDGELVDFDVTVRNEGPEDASGVTLNGTLDAGLAFESSDALPFRFSYVPATRTWSWDAQDLADQAAATLRVNARVAAALAPDVALQQTVSAFAASPSDPLPTLSTQIVGLGAAADLQVTRLSTSNDPDISIDSETLHGLLGSGWWVTVSNAGPDPIDGFVMQIDCGETELQIAYGPVMESPSCPIPPDDYSSDNSIACPLRCAVGPLASGAALQFNFDNNETSPPPRSVTVTVETDPALPFYDANTGNNASTWLPGTGAVFGLCGLLGIESPLFLGLVVLLRGRKGRAAFRRIFPGAALAVALLLGGSAQTAQATPVALAIDSSASSATVAITGTLGSPPPVGVTLSGSVGADVALGSQAPFGLVVQSLQLTGAAIALSDFSIGLSSVLLYDLTFSGNDIGASLAGPVASGFPVAPGLSLFDLFGSSLSFDTGTIDATGTYYGFPISESFDLSSSPLVSVFPINSVAQLQVVDLGGGTSELRLSFPFSAPLHLVIDTEPVSVTIAGTLVASGQVVPEPGSAPLLAAGLLAFTVLRRRFRGMQNTSSSRRQ